VNLRDKGTLGSACIPGKSQNEVTTMNTIITRRDFLRIGAAAAVGGLIGLPRTAPARTIDKSRVILIRNKDVLSGSGSVRAEVLEQMLDQALTTLLGTPDPISAWEQLVKAEEVVGIKSNAWYYLPTPRSLEAAIQGRLLKVGIKQENVAADDRGVLSNPVFQRATVLINTRPMRTHYWSGLGTLIKNYIMFTPRPSDYHDNACENLGALWHFPQVKGKTRLNILVMLTPQFHGVGPHSFSKEHLWNYCGLIVSTDPVSADATGAAIIQAKRDAFFGARKPISPPLNHITAADTRFGLGNSRPEMIEVIKLGWDEGVLI
ncbi:MAG: hypothetical protein H6Q48_2680, partial [Deltaproteobacteria bacterium]|nr:hypothetical protein [Deltaproteobacteria bacterium]